MPHISRCSNSSINININSSSSSSFCSKSNQKQHAPKWLRKRALGECNRVAQVSLESMRRLNLETTLEGHASCVNCLEWNKKGDLLASGSDDRNVILWNPFKPTTRKNIIKTNHEGNIFSVKFVPDDSDNLVATCAGDGTISVANILANETLLDCRSCHTGRIKRLAVHPSQPNLLWSAGEDGYIMQYDIRESHSCNSNRAKTVLIDLKTTQGCTKPGNKPLTAKCLAVNPMRDEMLAIGTNDVFIRLFDRRYVRQKASDSCIAQFSPGHLLKPNRHKSTGPRSFGATYVTFSPNGTEILANLHGEHIYLYNTYEPCEEYKSFDTLRSLLFDKSSCDAKFATNNNEYGDIEMIEINERAIDKNVPKAIKPRALWQGLPKMSGYQDTLTGKHSDYYMNIVDKLANNNPLGKQDFDMLNAMLVKIKNWPEIYLLRALALITRDWIGDGYEALRDCCRALSLEPRDSSAIRALLSAINSMGDCETYVQLVDFLRENKLSDGIATFDPSMDLSESNGQLMDNMNVDPYDWMRDEMDSSWLNSSINPEFATRSRNVDNISGKKVNQEHAYDYTKRFCGHCNLNTDIKEANFFGYDGEFIVAGSDDGAFYIWDKSTTNLVKAVQGDMHILNCLQPHPSICMLATSGIEPTVKLWSPIGKICHDVKALDQRCNQNQEFIATDPMEAMIMMLYNSEQEQGDI